MHDVALLRWFMVGFFALFGVWLIVARKRFASAGPLFCSACLDEPLQQRLSFAYDRRERDEALPSAWMGGSLGALSLTIAVLAAFTRVPVVVLYAVNVVALASVLTLAYVRLRQSTMRRVAPLQVRDPNAIAPWYAWTLVSIAVLLPLLWVPTAPLAAALIAAAGVAIVILARRVATMPALLSGEDVAVESFVDTRLRAVRAFNLLGTAVAPGFVLESFAGYTDSAAHAAAMGFGGLALLVMTFMLVRLVRRPPSQAELLTWTYAAP